MDKGGADEQENELGLIEMSINLRASLATGSNVAIVPGFNQVMLHE
ncbi:MAG: hypothetical protein ETSY1_02690 [Candidatus Entotheonella factor]|uniref:Uncharacterized protein n=1 Tax=Entotheonella factor TaxID=1429438 RepID=W4LXL6_ENTF1|nr:MAG: hypothetical protein ETSY1_02690 [Candidatus Entotheonella factor]